MILLADALLELQKASSIDAVHSLCLRIDEGFLADKPTVSFSGNDWVAWTDAIKNKVYRLQGKGNEHEER